jgi:GNAT superfamily N-acetyltransferase
MLIRPASSADSQVISDLLTYLANKYIAVEFAAEGIKNLLDSMTPDAIESFFNQGFRYHVGEVDTTVVGVIGTRDNSHLFHLFVDDEFQGQGYATQLWSVAKTACVEAGNPGYFTVNSSLNAQLVYKAWGFSPVGGIREGGGVRDVHMRMEISTLTTDRLIF